MSAPIPQSLQQQLDDLDRNWAQERQQFLRRNRRDQAGVPRASSAIFGAILLAGFGIVWMVVAIRAQAPRGVPLIGLLLTVIAFVGGVLNVRVYGKLRAAEKAYLLEREQILRSMNRPPG